MPRPTPGGVPVEMMAPGYQAFQYHVRRIAAASYRRVSEFIKHGKIIHIGVDKKELNKNKAVTLPI